MNWLTGVAKLIPLIVTAVGAVERLTSKKGKEKQDAAVTMIGDVLPLIEGAIGRDVVNEADVQTALRKVIDAVVALNNVVRDVVARRASVAGR